MLRICGPSYNQYDFQGLDDSRLYKVNGTKIILAEPATIDGNHLIQTSTTIWDCSLVLSKYIQKLELKDKSVVEVGAGRGLAGLTAAVMGANVILTDMAEALPTLSETVKLNNLETSVQVTVLNWHSPKSLGKVDYILAADVVWVVELIEPLVQTLDILSSQSTVIVFGYQSRSSQADDLLFHYLLQHGFKWESIDQSNDPKIQLYSISK